MIKSDIIGFTLGEAKEILKKRSVTIDEIIAAVPPKARDIEITDAWRVIMTRDTEPGAVQLIVCNPL